MSITLSSSPATEPVSRDQAKANTEEYSADRDDWFDNAIASARQHVEQHLRRALITQTWVLKMDRFPVWTPQRADSILIPRPPLQSVSSITYIDADGDSQTLSSSLYNVDINSTPGRVTPAYNQSWPTIREQQNAVTVTFVAGYGDDASDVPKDIYHAILVTVSEWFKNREGQGKLPQTARWLLSPHRVLDERIAEFV